MDADRRVGAVEGEQDEPGDDRRQREGQVDHGVQRAHLPRNVVADEHPGRDRPEDGVRRAPRARRRPASASARRPPPGSRRPARSRTSPAASTARRAPRSAGRRSPSGRRRRSRGRRPLPTLSLGRQAVVTRPRSPAGAPAWALSWTGLRRRTRSSTSARPGRTSASAAAANPPRVLSASVIWPGRTGKFLNCAAAAGLTGRKPFWPKTTCAGVSLLYWMNWFAASLFGLFSITAIGSWISSVWRGMTYWMFVPLRRGGDRLALVGDEHVTLAGEERRGRVRAGGRLRDDVLEQLLDVGDRLRVGLAEVALRRVGGEDVPLRRAGAPRGGRDHLDAGLDQVVPALDLLRVAVAKREDDDRVRLDAVVGLLVPVRVDEPGVDEDLDVARARRGRRGRPAGRRRPPAPGSSTARRTG